MKARKLALEEAWIYIPAAKSLSDSKQRDAVIPAEAGIQVLRSRWDARLDPGFRRGDGDESSITFGNHDSSKFRTQPCSI